MKKKIFISLIIVVITLTFSFIAYAYFSKIIYEEEVEINYDDTNIIYEQINSTDEFYSAIDNMQKIYQENVDYNLSESVSPIRLNYKFSDGLFIDATRDIIITVDCNIDFNQGGINLNGYDFIVKHQYKGVTTLTNGQLIGTTEGEERLIIDTNNSYVKYNLTLNNVEERINDVNKDILLTGALAFSIYNLNNYYPNFIDKLYDENGYKINDNNCKFDNCSNTNCIYTKDDLEFIDHYLGYDVTFTYESDSNVLSSYGDVNKTSSSLAQLTITASYKNELSKSEIVNVHIINPDDFSSCSDASLSILMVYLNSYNVTENDVSKIVFPNKLMLPYYDSYFNCYYNYEVFSGNNSLGNSKTGSIYFEPNNNNLILNMTASVDSIGISVYNDLNETEIEKVEITSESRLENFDNEDIASDITSRYFNGKINVVKKNGIYEISPAKLFSVSDLPNIISYESNVESIEYSLINNSINTYDLKKDGDEQYLVITGTVEDNNEPNELQNIQVAIKFTFKEGTKPIEVTKYVPIHYFEKDASGNPVTVSSFRPYYVYFNKYILDETYGYTYNDFSVPLNLDGTYPFYTLEAVFKDLDGNIISELSDAVDISLVSFDTEGNMSYYLYESERVTNQSILNLSSYSDILTNDLYWYINLDQSLLLENDTILELKFRYKMDGSSSFKYNESGEEKDNMLTTVNIPGILRCGENEQFVDATLYQIIYELFYLNEKYSYKEKVDGVYPETNTYLITNDVSKNLGNVTIGEYYQNGELSFSDNNDLTENKIESFKGLGYLTGIEKLNLSNAITCTLNTDAAPIIQDIDDIALMVGLKELNLSNNGLSDQKLKRDAANDTAQPGDYNNNFIRKLYNLSQLEVLNLSNNQIYSFSDLEGITSLKSIDVTNNTFTADYSLNIIITTINLSNVFTSLVNGLYGTNGATNISVFSALISRGVDVIGYNGNDDAVTNALVNALLSVEYQDELMASINLQDYLDETFSTNLADYGLPSTYDLGVSNEDVTIRNDSTAPTIKLTAVSETQFKISVTYYYVADPKSIFGGDPESFDVTFEVSFNISRY